jgi:hypothetical protein
MSGHRKDRIDEAHVRQGRKSHSQPEVPCLPPFDFPHFSAFLRVRVHQPLGPFNPFHGRCARSLIPNMPRPSRLRPAEGLTLTLSQGLTSKPAPKREAEVRVVLANPPVSLLALSANQICQPKFKLARRSMACRLTMVMVNYELG